MIFDPINSITSVEFYRKVAKQTVTRSFLYLAYLSAIFSLAATIALKIKVGPVIDETFQWLEREVPTMTFADGKLTTANPAAATIRHPRYSEIAVTIDTTRVEPVTPDILERNRVVAYVTGTAMYLMERPGDMRTFDFRTGGASRPVVIDGAFYRSAAQVMARLLYPLSVLLTFLIFMSWKSLASLAYSALALALNSAAQASLPYKDLFNISVHAQTLIIAIQAIFLFMPVSIPFSALVAAAMTGVYLWLAIKRNQESAAA